MTNAELRALVETDLPEAALSTVLGAAAELVEERLGPFGPVTEVRYPSGPVLGFSRRAIEVLSVTERDVVLDADEYALRPSGRMLDKVNGRWRGKVVVRYQPISDAQRRDAALVALVSLHLDYHPGLTAAHFGSWSESYSTNVDYRAARDAIMAALDGSDDGFLH